MKIAEHAKKHGKVQNLMVFANKENLALKHRSQGGKKASGVDGIAKSEYGQKLDENLDDLVARMKNFSYKSLPVRRTYIPKIGSDKLRPLGIPAYEDKLVQGVMADMLTAIYEPKFLDMSYGFRPKCSCHQAILDLDGKIMHDSINYIVDADIKGFFDNVDHDWLIKFLEHDIADKRFIRYIKRFIKSGIMENGKYLESDKGTPQGGLISPILANIYLHYVLDLWFEKVVKKECRYYASIVRYADDFVCCFQYESEAKKFLGLLKERLAKFGLELAEDKTKIIPFGRFQRKHKETFDFLGFTHVNGVTRKGKYKLVHITSAKKLKAKMQSVKQWLKENMHIKPSELISKMNVKLTGHYRYYGISDNHQRMSKFGQYCRKELYHVLNRRNQYRLTWEKFDKIMEAPYIWSDKTIHDMIDRREYLGHTYTGKRSKSSYKSKKEVKNPIEKQHFFPNTHEPLIDDETFEVAQKRASSRTRPTKFDEIDIFTGVLFCATCGSNLGYHFNQRNHDIQYFNCANYNNRGSTCDATHYIRVDFLEQIILSELRRITFFAERYEEEFVKIVLNSALREMEKAGRNRQRELDTLITRDKELDVLFKRIYEDSLSGRITEDRFARMSKKHEDEQAELKSKIAPLKKEIAKHNRHNCTTDEFLAVVRKYIHMKELTQEILH